MIFASVIARIVEWFGTAVRPDFRRADYRCVEISALAMLDSTAGS
jgi:hypothetical protein